VMIELFAPAEVSIRDLQQWLVRTTKLLIDSPRFGNGPIEGSYGAVRIDWGQLREVPE
jgi:hypothetical protein